MQAFVQAYLYRSILVLNPMVLGGLKGEVYNMKCLELLLLLLLLLLLVM